MFEIDMDDFVKLSNVNVIDLRCVEKYNNSHIPGAVNIPFDKLICNPSNYFNKNTKYYLYCQHGYTSKNACKVLLSLGYNVININGGFENWLFNNY